MIEVVPTRIPEVKIVTLVRHTDARGFFSETYNQRDWQAAGIDPVFVQDNHSYSADAHVVRGLHFQYPPRAQHKIVRVIRGAILDVAVDLRRSSASFGQHVAVTLRAEAWSSLFVPIGFAHGFCTLESHTEVVYKTSDFYSPQHDAGLRWNDPALRIAWPISAKETIVSDKDRGYPTLAELQSPFE